MRPQLLRHLHQPILGWGQGRSMRYPPSHKSPAVPLSSLAMCPFAGLSMSSVQKDLPEASGSPDQPDPARDHRAVQVHVWGRGRRRRRGQRKEGSKRATVRHAERIVGRTDEEAASTSRQPANRQRRPRSVDAIESA